MDGVVATSGNDHTRGTTGTVGEMKVGPDSDGWFDGVDSSGGAGRHNGAGRSLTVRVSAIISNGAYGGDGKLATVHLF